MTDIVVSIPSKEEVEAAKMAWYRHLKDVVDDAAAYLDEAESLLDQDKSADAEAEYGRRARLHKDAKAENDRLYDEYQRLSRLHDLAKVAGVVA